MTIWKKLHEELVYDGWKKIVRRTYKMPNGKTEEYDIAVTTGGAAILALTPNNKILCFKQFRPGPGRELYELPGGSINPGEEPLAAASRELREETGYSGDIEWLGSYARDAYMTGEWHMFVCKNAVKTSEQELDHTEEGDVLLLSIDEFKEKLFAGEMTDTTLGYAGLLRLGLL